MRDEKEYSERYGKPTTYRLPTELVDKVRTIADQEGVGLSELAEYVLTRFVQDHAAGKVELPKTQRHYAIDFEAIERGRFTTERNYSLLPMRLRILLAIERFGKAEGRPPTIRDIASRVGVSSTSHVKYHIDILNHRGFITHSPRSARSTMLTTYGSQALKSALQEVTE